MLQFFKISRYLPRSEKMCDERLLLLYNFLASKPKISRIFGRALMAFSAYKFSDNRGENKSKLTENYIEWLTTIELTAKQGFKSVIALQASATFLRSFLDNQAHDFARG